MESKMELSSELLRSKAIRFRDLANRINSITKHFDNLLCLMGDEWGLNVSQYASQYRETTPELIKLSQVYSDSAIFLENMANEQEASKLFTCSQNSEE